MATQKQSGRPDGDGKEERRTGRPSDYTDQLALDICRLISSTTRSLKSICDELGTTTSSVYRWLEDDRRSMFRELYARAKSDQIALIADQIIEIADDDSEDVMTVTVVDKKGNERTFETANHARINRARLQVDSRKWLLSKLAPRRYGDLVGKDDGTPDNSIKIDSAMPEEPRDDGKTDKT